MPNSTVAYCNTLHELTFGDELETLVQAAGEIIPPLQSNTDSETLHWLSTTIKPNCICRPLFIKPYYGTVSGNISKYWR